MIPQKIRATRTLNVNYKLTDNKFLNSSVFFEIFEILRLIKNKLEYFFVRIKELSSDSFDGCRKQSEAHLHNLEANHVH